jgi:hypothetical protein
MDAVEIGIALALEELCGMKACDIEEKEESAALDRLDHEVRDGPDVLFGDAAGELAIVDAEGDQEDDERPERYIAEDVAQAQAREREVLGERPWQA